MFSQTRSIEETVAFYARQLQDAQPSRVHKTLIEMQRLAEEEVIKMQARMHESNCFVQPDSYVNAESQISLLYLLFDMAVSG